MASEDTSPLARARENLLAPPLALSYDDVLIEPQYSPITSRRHVSTRTRLARDIHLEIPIISSNMDTVTTATMAVAMAQLGGIGFIHRFLTINDEVAMLKRVKRNRAHVIWDPYEISPEAPVEEAERSMDQYEVGGLMVIDPDGRLIGIITRRDVAAASSGAQRVSELMTPRSEMACGTIKTTADEAHEVLRARRVEKLPLLDDAGRAVGLIVMKDIRRLKEFPSSSIDDQGRYLVGASVGVVGDYLERAEALVEAGADVLVVDVAHAHAKHALDGVRELSAAQPETPIVAGTIATPEGVRDLVEAGADAIRCGIGAGSACTTRMVAGAGVPMFTSVVESAAEAKRLGVPLIADGGIRRPSDLSKAIGAGAHTAMLGSVLAGTEEAPGRVTEREGRKMKVYRGMASMGAFLDKKMSEGESDEAAADYTPEGVESVIPLVGPVGPVVRELVGGLRSGMSYTGVETIDDFHRDVRFRQITAAGQVESSPHVLLRGERE